MNQHNHQLSLIGFDLEKSELVKEAQWGRIKRILYEGVSSSYKEKMKILKDQDDSIRAWTKDLGQIASLMNKYRKQGKMTELGYLLETFNRRLVQIGIFGKAVQDITEEAKVQHEQGGDDLARLTQQFADPKDKKDKKNNIGKQAGFWENTGWAKEWFANKYLGNDWRKERDEALQKVISSAIQTVDGVNEALSQMKKARNHGNIAEYSEIVDHVAKIQNAFFKIYKPIYDKYLKSFVDQAMTAAKSETKPLDGKPEVSQEDAGTVAPQVADLGTLDYPIGKSAPPSAEPVDLGTLDPTETPSQEEVSVETNPMLPQKAPMTESSEIPNVDPIKTNDFEGVVSPELLKKQMEESEQLAENEADESENKINAHSVFFGNFEKLANSSSNEEAVQYLLRYSSAIEDIDPETSFKLLAIAEGFLDQ